MSTKSQTDLRKSLQPFITKAVLAEESTLQALVLVYNIAQSGLIIGNTIKLSWCVALFFVCNASNNCGQLQE